MTVHTSEANTVTASVCDAAALYGATPERGETDTRDIWDRDDALDAVTEAFRILAQGVAPDGTQIADERESLLWGFVNAFDAQVRRLDRAVDRIAPELRDLANAQDGTEINARELELLTDRARNLGDRRDAFETMRDAAADAYRTSTGDVWRPRHGSHTSQTGKLTSAAIDARDFIRARKDRQTAAHMPQGTLVAIAGGKDAADPAAVIDRLDRARAKHADLVLVHGGGPGVERIAAQWAERNGVHQIVCKPDWDRHGRAHRAPYPGHGHAPRGNRQQSRRALAKGYGGSVGYSGFDRKRDADARFRGRELAGTGLYIDRERQERCREAIGKLRKPRRNLPGTGAMRVGRTRSASPIPNGN